MKASLAQPILRRLRFLIVVLWIVPGLLSPAIRPQIARAASTTVVISEFRTRGPSGGNDEFIELYNLSAGPVDIGGWKIQASNGSGTVVVRLIIGPGVILPAHAHFLATNNNASGGYSGSVLADQNYNTGVTDNGGIALTLADDTVVDQVGMSSGSSFREGTPLAPLSANANQSYERKPGGALGSSVDSDDNAADFLFHPASSDPQNLASAPVPPADRLSGTGSATPAFAAPGETLLLAVQVAPALSPPSTGLTVSANLSAIGGLSDQAFYDDGSHSDGPAGDLTYSFQAVIASSASPGKKSLPVTIRDAQGRSGSAAIGLEVTGGCGTAYTAIPAIQGSALTSLLAGAVVETEGVVVGDFQGASGLDGFYIEDPVGDGNPATSDGLFVYLPAASPLSAVDVHPGDRVRARGTVSEYYGLTELSQLAGLSVCGSGQVNPVAADLPQPVDGFLERYEGMLVTFSQPLTVSDNYFQARYGQVILSSGGRLYTPTNGQGGTPESNARRRLVLDDGSAAQYPNPLPYLGADQTLRAGDAVSGLTGVLDQGLAGSGSATAYRLQPVGPVAFTRANPRSAAPPAMQGNLKVASFNVDNYFTTLNSRGAHSTVERTRQRDKLVAALKAIDADIVGLVEIENNSSALSDLVGALNAAVPSGSYSSITEPNPGTDEIKVSLIYRPDRVAPVGPPLNYQVSVPPYVPLFDRPPLAQTFRLLSNGQVFTVVVNHFKSKGCDGASGADADQGQGCWNAKRKQQAQYLLGFLNNLKIASKDPDILVIGDLNSYGEEDPIHVLTAGGLWNEIAARVPPAQRYSYSFDAQAGTLDHALATATLHAQVTGAVLWHINADEPAVLDYHTENKFPDLYQPTPYRSSDHDPLVLELTLKPPIFLPYIRH